MQPRAPETAASDDFARATNQFLDGGGVIPPGRDGLRAAVFGGQFLDSGGARGAGEHPPQSSLVPDGGGLGGGMSSISGRAVSREEAVYARRFPEGGAKLVVLGDPRTIEGQTCKNVDYSMAAGVRWSGELIAYLRESKHGLITSTDFGNRPENPTEFATKIDDLIAEMTSVRATMLEAWKWFASPPEREVEER